MTGGRKRDREQRKLSDQASPTTVSEDLACVQHDSKTSNEQRKLPRQGSGGSPANGSRSSLTKRAVRPSSRIARCNTDSTPVNSHNEHESNVVSLDDSLPDKDAHPQRQQQDSHGHSSQPSPSAVAPACPWSPPSLPESLEQLVKDQELEGAVESAPTCSNRCTSAAIDAQCTNDVNTTPAKPAHARTPSNGFKSSLDNMLPEVQQTEPGSAQARSSSHVALSSMTTALDDATQLEGGQNCAVDNDEVNSAVPATGETAGTYSDTLPNERDSGPRGRGLLCIDSVRLRRYNSRAGASKKLSFQDLPDSVQRAFTRETPPSSCPTKVQLDTIAVLDLMDGRDSQVVLPPVPVATVCTVSDPEPQVHTHPDAPVTAAPRCSASSAALPGATAISPAHVATPTSDAPALHTSRTHHSQQPHHVLNAPDTETETQATDRPQSVLGAAAAQKAASSPSPCTGPGKGSRKQQRRGGQSSGRRGVAPPSPPMPQPPPTPCVRRDRASVPQSVPPDCRDAWGAATAAGIAAIVDALHHGVGAQGRHQLQEALAALSDLPALALADPGASKSRGRRALARLNRMALGLQPDDVEGLGSESPRLHDRRRRRSTIASQEKMALRIQRYLNRGSVSRAAKVLESEPIADMSIQRNLNALKNLHPQALAPQMLEETSRPLQVDSDLVCKVVQTLSAHHRGRAGGPTGWTYEMIIAAATRDDDSLRAVVQMVNLILSGTLPRDSFLLDSTLIGTVKAAGGIRPIAIGEAWYRFAMLCALFSVGKTLAVSLAPLQVGVGMRGGVEAVAHAIQTALDSNPEYVVLSVDMENAFNTVDRTAVFLAVKEHAPSLLPVVQWAYGQPTNLHVLGAPAGTPPILSHQGVRQGDPLGPLLFALALQKPLQGALQQVPGTSAVAFLDDCTIVGLPPAVRGIMHIIDGNGPNSTRAIGLRIRKRKCGLYGGDSSTCAALAAELSVPHRPEGLTVVGVPIGKPDFQKDTVNARASKVIGLVDLLRSLPKLGCQAQWCVIRWSLNVRMTHYLRVLPWDLICSALRRVEGRVLKAAQELFQLPAHLPDKLIAQLAAPIRHGGFALTTASPTVARAAFLSGAAMAQIVMSDGPSGFRPFDGPSADKLRQDWDQLYAAFKDDCKWPETGAELSAETIQKVLPMAQRHVGRALEDRLHTQSLGIGASPTEDAKRDVSRVRSCAGAPSGAWLMTLPVGTRAMGNSAFRHAARHRLGLGVPQHLTPPPCTCGRGLADRPDHAMVCTQCTKQATLRHDLVALAVRRRAVDAGCPTNRETGYRVLAANPGQAMEAGLTRCDVLVMGPDGTIYLLDIVVTHQHMGCQLDRCYNTTGKAAQLAAEEKIRQFRLHGDAEQYKFVPFAVESHGRICKEGVAFLQEMGDWACGGDRGAKSLWMMQTYKDISVALQKGNGMMYTKSCERLIRAQGRHFMPGASTPGVTV